MRVLIATFAIAILSAPVPAFAQEGDTEVAAADIESKLRDPAMQAAVSEGVAAASEAMLDIPLAPLARAVAEATGEDPDAVDPYMTMRSVSPDAQDMSDRVREALPRMMGAMGSVAGGIGAMMPALHEMAARMRAAIDAAADNPRD